MKNGNALLLMRSKTSVNDEVNNLNTWNSSYHENLHQNNNVSNSTFFINRRLSRKLVSTKLEDNNTSFIETQPHSAQTKYRHNDQPNTNCIILQLRLYITKEITNKHCINCVTNTTTLQAKIQYGSTSRQLRLATLK